MTTTLPTTHKGQVDVRQTRLLIDGEFQDALSGKTFATVDPVTEEEIAAVAEGDADDIDRAVQAARRALDEGPWSSMSARERGKTLLRFADLLETHTEELARLEVIDNGKTLRECLGYDIPSAAAIIRYFGGWADKIEGRNLPIPGDFFSFTRREPVGVCGQIIPWNFPLAMASWKLGPALAAGCTTVLKPAEQTPLSALRAGELALEAGIPEGVLNIVPGMGATAGDALARHPGVDKLAFTGSVQTAEKIKQASSGSMKRMSLELGGKSPNVIMDDASIDEAVEGAYSAIFLNNGQNCCAGTRTFVHAKIYDEVVEKLAKMAKAARVGDPFDDDSDHGALTGQAQLDKALRYIEAGQGEGARCVAGGNRVHDQGFFVEPTVFADVKDDMVIAREEIFGPVMVLMRFEKLDEVIQRANDTDYGLAAGIWTKDVATAHAFASAVKAGTVWVNCYNIVDAATPFGGFKQSGYGRELGEKALDMYTEHKTVTMSVARN